MICSFEVHRILMQHVFSAETSPKHQGAISSISKAVKFAVGALNHQRPIFGERIAVKFAEGALNHQRPIFGHRTILKICRRRNKNGA
jgi:hypothetical protein